MYFSELFGEAKSNEAYYNGEKIYSWYSYDKKGKSRIKFRFVNSRKSQCIVIVLDPEKSNCKFFYDGQELKSRGKAFPTIDLFEDYFGKEFIIDVEIKDGNFSICNGSVIKIENKTFVDFMDRTYAMKIEEKGNVINFKCNSDENSTDFDDLEFEMEILD